MKYIIGIDQSLNCTGICIMKDNDYKTFIIKPYKLTGTQRLEYIKVELTKLLNDQFLYKGIDVKRITGIMEGYSYGSIGRTFELGELGGMIKLVFNAFGIPLDIVAPCSWKKAVVGKGNANKDKIKLEIKERYNLTFDTQDQADAWAMCIYKKMLLQAGWDE